MKNICVYASSSNDVDPVYQAAAARMGELIAQRECTLIYGAGSIGLMGVVARAVHAAGGHVVGVITEKLRVLELAYEEADELIVVETMRERKAIMEQRADAFVALPGGLGTLEEIIEVLVLKILEYHNKPLIFLNTEGIYDGLLTFFDHLIEQRFIQERHRVLYHVAATPEEVFAYIDAYAVPEAT